MISQAPRGSAPGKTAEDAGASAAGGYRRSAEELPAITRHPFLDGQEWLGVSGLAKRADVGLSEILVLARKRLRKFRVLDEAVPARLVETECGLRPFPAAGVDDSQRDIVEAENACLP